MRVKRTKFTCSKCKQSVSVAYPKCDRCGITMEAEGDKFFDHVKILNLRRSKAWSTDEDETGKRKLYYNFDLSVGGFIINGCTYNGAKGSLMFPYYIQGNRRVRTVNAFGTTAKQVRRMVYNAILELEQGEEIAA